MADRTQSLIRVTAHALLLAGLAGSPSVRAGLWPSPTPGQNSLLPVDEALRLEPAVLDGDQLLIGWDLAEGCYLYRDKLQIEVLSPDGAGLATLDLPAGEAHEDEHFGAVRILRGRVEGHAGIIGELPTRIRVRYQGCAEGLVCYPPQTRELDVAGLPTTAR